MLKHGATRGFAPEVVIFDGWYSSLDSLKCNQLVNPEGTGVRPPSSDTYWFEAKVNIVRQAVALYLANRFVCCRFQLRNSYQD